MTSTTKQHHPTDQTFHRDFSFNREHINEDARTVDLAFVSEEPVERYFGLEILDVSKSSMRLDRLRNGAALLVDHDHRGQVGVVESISIDPDRVGRATVRFGKSDRANEVFSDVVDGIRRHVSFGYRVYKAVLEEKNEDGPDSYRVTDFEPFEISIVSVPADASVGVGRGFDPNAETPFFIKRNLNKETIMSTEIKNNSIQEERTRITEISAIADRFSDRIDGLKEEANNFIGNERSIAEFRKFVMDKMGRNVKPLNLDDTQPNLSLSGREQREYSITRAISAMADPKAANEGLEFEISEELKRNFNKKSRGILVPLNALDMGMPESVTSNNRAITAAASGAALIGEHHLGQQFIDVLRSKSFIMRLNIREILVNDGDISIPRKLTSASAFWIEGDGTDSITESSAGFDNVKLSPKTVGALTNYSHRMLIQGNPGIEQIVRQDLAAVIASEIDLQAIQGDGTGFAPLGILNTTGIGGSTYTLGGFPTYSDIVGMETSLSMENADLGSLAHLTTPTLKGKLKITDVGTDTGMHVWSDGREPGVGSLNDMPAYATNNMPAKTVILGNWNDFLLAHWGVMDISADPYGSNFAKGSVSVRAMMDVDFSMRHPASFHALTEALV